MGGVPEVDPSIQRPVQRYALRHDHKPSSGAQERIQGLETLAWGMEVLDGLRTRHKVVSLPQCLSVGDEEGIVVPAGVPRRLHHAREGRARSASEVNALRPGGELGRERLCGLGEKGPVPGVCRVVLVGLVAGPLVFWPEVVRGIHEQQTTPCRRNTLVQLTAMKARIRATLSEAEWADHAESSKTRAAAATSRGGGVMVGVAGARAGSAG